MVDLTKKMTTPMQPDFIRVASYEGTETTGKINIIADLQEDIKGKNVLVVEDIIDSGKTLSYLVFLVFFFLFRKNRIRSTPLPGG
mgnify:CR=1 FL=1